MSASKESSMARKRLLHNASVHTNADGLVVDSIAISGDRIAAVGRQLAHDPAFRSWQKIDLQGRMVTPGLVDAHVHLYYYALTLSRVSLHECRSLDACLKKISRFARSLDARAWIVGEGYDPNCWPRRIDPDRTHLDRVSGGRPAFIFAKDHHSVWINSKTLEIAGIDAATPDPDTGQIVRDSNGTPTGILREAIGYEYVFSFIPKKNPAELHALFDRAVAIAHEKGVTAVHSFDSPEALPFYLNRAERNKLALRVFHYPRVSMLPDLIRSGTSWGTGTPFFRFAGIKLFADGTLGSQTAHCFAPYLGSRANRGIATTSVADMKRAMSDAARLGMPCAIHAIGDHAVANVLSALRTAPALSPRARHRIEHAQLVRPEDIRRMKQLGVVASMQPSHCPSDISMIRRFWGARRGRHAFPIRSMLSAGIPLAFGSDLPIEPIDPLAGIAAAVRRALPRSRDHFELRQAATISEALHAFTAGAAFAVGAEQESGYLLPGYLADLTIVPHDITRRAAASLYSTNVTATIVGGRVVYSDGTVVFD